jgi:hypothetical protein
MEVVLNSEAGLVGRGTRRALIVSRFPIFRLRAFCFVAQLSASQRFGIFPNQGSAEARPTSKSSPYLLLVP